MQQYQWIRRKIIALYADGMSQADILATIKDMYDVNLAQSTISAITDKVIPVM
jgi:transposase-like protein